jgi:hypothetical protein
VALSRFEVRWFPGLGERVALFWDHAFTRELVVDLTGAVVGDRVRRAPPTASASACSLAAGGSGRGSRLSRAGRSTASSICAW